MRPQQRLNFVAQFTIAHAVAIKKSPALQRRQRQRFEEHTLNLLPAILLHRRDPWLPRSILRLACNVGEGCRSAAMGHPGTAHQIDCFPRNWPCQLGLYKVSKFVIALSTSA